MMKLFAEGQERTLTRKETQTAGEQRRVSTRKKNEPLTATFCDLLPCVNTTNRWRAALMDGLE
jgi:hypothetical protein